RPGRQVAEARLLVLDVAKVGDWHGGDIATTVEAGDLCVIRHAVVLAHQVVDERVDRGGDADGQGERGNREHREGRRRDKATERMTKFAGELGYLRDRADLHRVPPV